MNKFMRIIVLFDLPTKTKPDRDIYSNFRKFLLKDGFQMLQYSVYVRLCNGNFDTEKHAKRIQSNTPKQGRVLMLVVTNKQFEDMKYLVGEKMENSKKIRKKNKNSSQIKGQLTLF